MFEWLKGKSEAEPASLFGKIPNQPDFVRVRAAGPIVDRFDAWLQASLTQLDRDGLTPGDEPTFFLFSAAGAKKCMLGALKASRDAVGRKFPVAVYAMLDAQDTARGLGALIATQDAFLDDVALSLGLTSRMSAGELRSRLDTLRPASGAELKKAAARWADVKTATPLGELLARPLGADLDAWSYALYAFKKAADPVVGGKPEGPGPTLDCPIRSRADIGLWLTLAEAGAKWKKAPPPLLWREGAAPRLLLTLGLAPPNALSFLADPSAEDGRLWPMVTDNDEVRAAAKSTLSAPLVEALGAPDNPISDLLAALTK